MGISTLPDLHDFALTGVQWSEGRLELNISDESARELTICLTGVLRLRVSELLEENVIYEAFMLKGEESCDKRGFTPRLREWVERLHLGHLLSNTHPAFLELSSQVDKICESVITQHAFVFVLTPSYGCELIALARAIDISDLKHVD